MKVRCVFCGEEGKPIEWAKLQLDGFQATIHSCPCKWMTAYHVERGGVAAGYSGGHIFGNSEAEIAHFFGLRSTVFFGEEGHLLVGPKEAA